MHWPALFAPPPQPSVPGPTDSRRFSIPQGQEAEGTTLARRALLKKALVLGGLLLGQKTAMVTSPASMATELGGAPPKGTQVAMSTGAASKFIQENCQGILALYKKSPSQRFLYRGEDIHRPTYLACLPDLLDPVTYKEPEAAAFFAKMEVSMKDFPVRPSTGHLATSDMRAAAAWGSPCSIWPLGDEKSLHYAWLKDAREWWPVPPALRNASVATISACVKREMQVDKGLNDAIKQGREVLLRCELDKEPGSFGFLVVPEVYERELRARLGLAYD